MSSLLLDTVTKLKAWLELYLDQLRIVRSKNNMTMIFLAVFMISALHSWYQKKKTIPYWQNKKGFWENNSIFIKYQIETITKFILQETKTKQTLRKKCSNTELFLVRIFLYSNRVQENTDVKKLHIGHFSRSQRKRDWNWYWYLY